MTLEEDLAARLLSESHRSGRPIAELVNEYLRVVQRPFVVKARPLGLHPGLEYDNVGELIESVEGPHRR